MAGNKRVYVSADKVFKDIVSEILVSDNYLDALEIKEVGSQLSFTRLEQFRTIQQYNKKVDSLVDSYVYTRALYFYSELEKLILDTFTIWLKLDPPPTNFEEIGIGNLMRCSKIMKLFGFDAQASRHNLYEPDRKKILQLVQAHCLAEGDNLNIYNNKLDDFVKNGVRDCMPCHCVLAFAFDGRELFYAFRGSFLAFKKKNSTDFNMKENMNRIHLEYVQGKKMALQHSFKEMVSKNSPRSFSQEVDKCQRIVRDYIGKMPEYQSLKKSLRSMDTYSRLLYLLYHRYFTLSSHGVGKESDGTGNGEAHLGSDEHTVLQEQLFLCTWYDIYNGKTELGKLNLLYKYDFVAYMAVFCVASLSYCLSSCPFVFLVSQEEDTNEDSAEYIIRILRSQYTDDIPDFALDQLEELLGETVNAGSGRVEYTAKGKVTKVQLDYEALLLNATARIVQKRVQAPEGVALDLRKLTASGCLIACPYCKQRKANVMQHVKDCHPTKLDTTDPSRFRTTLTWSDPSNAVVDAAKSSHIKIPQDKFIAAATAIILFHRIMFVENVAPHPSDSKILAIKFETFVEKTLQDKGEQELEMDSLLSNLQVLESGLKEELNVPSMECTGLGSFLTLINKPYQSTLLKRLFSLKVMVGNESDNQSLEAGNKSMVSFPSLNVDALHVVLDDIVNHMPPFTNLAPLKLLAYIQQSIQDNDENCSNFVDQMLEAANQDADLAAKLAVVFQSVSPINQATDMVEEDGVKSSLEWMQNSVAFEIHQRDLVPAAHLITCLLTLPSLRWELSLAINESNLKRFAEWTAMTLFCLPVEVARQLAYCIIDKYSLRYDSENQRFVSTSNVIDVDGVEQLNIICGRSVLVWNYLVQDILSHEHHRAALYKYTNEHQHLVYKPSSITSINHYEQALIRPAWKKDVVDKLIMCLANVQPGQTCIGNTVWSHLAQQLLTDPADELPSLLQFLILYELDLVKHPRNASNSCVFVVTGYADTFAGYDCCLIVTAKLMNAKELRVKFTMKSFDALAVSMCSARFVADKGDLRDKVVNNLATNIWDRRYLASFRSCLLEMYAAKGVDAFTDLATALLDVVYTMHDRFQLKELTGSTFRSLIEVLGEIAGVNSEAVQKIVWTLSATVVHKRLMLCTLGLHFSGMFPYLKLMAVDYVESSQFNRGVWEEEENSISLDSNGYVPDINITGHGKSAVHEEEKSLTELVPLEDVKQAANVSTLGVNDPQRAFILQLLQKEFHYDQNGQRPLEESPEGKKLKCSLDLLSASLYSSDVHFVMELLQNADDNNYHAGVVPTLKLQLLPHALVIMNNEVGFSQDNIVAVCNVGGSTKKGMSGYIGQKGIGFKSVFSISDRPEIHSNGFHIMFDQELSMLEPVWLEDVESTKSLGRWPNQYDVVDGGTYFETCLRLALNVHSRKNIAKLTHEMEEVFDGKLILFLNKLQRMLLENRNDNSYIEHVRYQLSVYWTKIVSQYQNVATAGCTSVNKQHAQNDAYWWTVRCVIEKPMVRRLGVEIASTEIVLAFKFRECNREVDRAVDVNARKVLKLDYKEGLLPIYAFLPTLTLCFNFIIQADFVLATSRESVMDGNDWNVMLLDHIPELFIAAVQELVAWMKYRPAVNLDQLLSTATPLDDNSNDNFQKLITGCPRLISLVQQEQMDIEVTFSDILALIPLTSKVNRHLHPCLHLIYDALKRMQLIPDQSNELQCPKDTLLTQDLHFNPALYISPDILQESCQKTLLHFDQQMHLNDEIISILGIRSFDPMHVVACIKQLSKRRSAGEGSAFDVTGESSRSEYIKHLSGLLYALCLYLTAKLELHNSTGRLANVSIKKHLTPTQVVTSSHSKISKDTSALQGRLQSTHAQKDLINVLKGVALWPVAGRDNVISLESSIVFVKGNDVARGSSSLSHRQLECLSFFQNDLLILDESLFHAIDKNFLHSSAGAIGDSISYNNSSIRPSDRLRTFLLSSFAPLTSLLINIKPKMYAGGLCLITADMIVSSVILPIYRAAANATHISASSSAGDAVARAATDIFDSQECLDHSKQISAKHVSRTKVAAYLALIFSVYSDSATGSNKLLETLTKDTGVLMPTLSAKDPNNRETKWSYSKVYPLRADISQVVEIHTGSEIFDSFTAKITQQLSLCTALRQLGWTVVDPLATVLAVGGGDKLLLEPDIVADDKNITLSNLKVLAFCEQVNRDKMKKWKDFLHRLGVVDFFQVHSKPVAMHEDKGGGEESVEWTPEICVPGLVRYLSHMLRYGHKVSCYSRAATSHIGQADNDMELTGSTIPFIPLHLPYSYELQVSNEEEYQHQQVLKVSREVYFAMKSLLPWVACELTRFTSRGALPPGVKQCVTDYLQSMAWCPIEVYHGDIYKRLASDSPKSTEEVFLLAAPRDIIMGKTSQDVGKDIVGPHFAYLPRDAYPQPLGKVECSSVSNFHEWYGFCVASEKDEPDVDFWLNLVAWKAQLPATTTLYSSVSFYSKIYERFMNHLDSLQQLHAGKGVTDRTKARIQSLIAADERILWIPYESGSSKRGKYVSGSMVALSNVAKDDATGYLKFDQSPVKVLLRYYPVEYHKAAALYARNEYCFRCKAAEGMFGVRGRSKEFNLSSQPAYICTCFDEGIGKYLPSLPGLISESPNLQQMIKLLLYHKGAIERRTSTQELVKASHNEYMKILSSISSNIWKCFHIKQALHPYSALQLNGLLTEFQQHSLLPGVSSVSSFVSVSLIGDSKQPISLLAIDDNAIYHTFREYIDQQGFILVNSGMQAEDDAQGVRRTVQVFFIEERLGGVQSAFYDLEILAAEQQALLLSSDSEFKMRTSFISPLTFFAPKNILPLFKLLRIPLLSEYIEVDTAREVDIVYQKTSRQAVSVRFAELMTDMLKLTEAFIRRELEKLKTSGDEATLSPASRILKTFAMNPNEEHSLVSKLTLAKSTQKLLNLKVSECSKLQRQLKLTLPSGIVADAIVQDSVQMEDAENYYHVYLSASAITSELASEVLTEVAILCILQVLMFELALLTTNQQVAFIQTLEDFLRKSTKASKESFPMFLQFEEIEEHYKSASWILRDPIQIAEDIVVEERVTMKQQALDGLRDEKEEGEIVDDAAIAFKEERTTKSLAAYAALAEKAKSRAKMRAAQSVAKKVEKAKEDVEAAIEQKKERTLEIAKTLLEDLGIVIEETTVPEHVKKRSIEQAEVVVEYMQYGQGHRKPTKEASRHDNRNLREGIVDRVQIVPDDSVGRDQSQPLQAAFCANPATLPVLHEPRNIIYWRSDDSVTSAGPPRPLGRWNSRINANCGRTGANQTTSLQEVRIPDELLQKALDDELNNNASYQTSVIGSEDIPVVSNAMTGRLGEQLAKRYLMACAMENGIHSVEWCNETREQGLPYDLIVTLHDGRKKLAEVKTRSSSHSVIHQTWPISVAEIREAQRHPDYFLVLFSLQLDYEKKTFGVSKAVVLGWQEGLAGSLVQAQHAQLLIRVQNEINVGDKED